MPSSTKPRPTNSASPSVARPTSSTAATTSSPTPTSPTNVPTASAPRAPAKKLVASDALARYLTYEDRRDRSFMAILAAFSTVNNQALCVKELVDVVRDNQLLNLGGATPSGTINSAIRNHINRCVERQLPCLLSRHVLSGDASDERLAPAIGVKPHHRRRAPPIVADDTLGEGASTSASLPDQSAPISPISPIASSSTSPITHTSSQSTPPAAASSEGKIYLRNKNGRTRKGVCLWFLSPWTGFANPFVREGFGTIGFLSEGKPVEEGEKMLSESDFVFRWVGQGTGTGRDRDRGEREPAGPSGSVIEQEFGPPGAIGASASVSPSGAITFFTSTAPVATSASATASSSTAARPRKPKPSASSSAPRNRKSATTATATTSKAATSKVASASTSTTSKAAAPSKKDSKARIKAKAKAHAKAQSQPPSVQVPSSIDEDGTESSLAAARPIPTSVSSAHLQTHNLAPLQIPSPSSSISVSDPSKKEIVGAPLSPAPSTIDDMDLDSSSDVDSASDRSVSSDDSDLDSESDSDSDSEDDARSEVATTVDEDAESDADADADAGMFDFAAEPRASWELASEGMMTDDEEEGRLVSSYSSSDERLDDEDDEDEDDEDDDGAMVITPRSSVTSSMPKMIVHGHGSTAGVAGSPSPFPGWGDFPAASAAMTMELSVGLESAAAAKAQASLLAAGAAARTTTEADATAPQPASLLSMPPAVQHPDSVHTHVHHEQEHDHGHGHEHDSPFIPLSATAISISSSHPSPSRASALDLHMEDIHMDLGIHMSMSMPMDIVEDAGLAAQNGDARRAAEDDILIDELLAGPESALPHEFEEAWSSTSRDSSRVFGYPPSPSLSSRSLAVASPVPIVSSHHRRHMNLQRVPSPETQSPVDIVASGGAAARSYCPGICVPMHRPASRGEVVESDAHVPRISLLPSTPPRTPSPFSRSSSSSQFAQTPQAELDALIVPGASVSESPTPPSLLLPADEQFPSQHDMLSEGSYHVPPPTPTHLAPLPLGPHQLGQIVIHTTTPANPPICATFVDGFFVYTLTHPHTGQKLLRAVDSDYVHLSSLIAISRPPLSPSDALRIISLCHAPNIIPPSYTPHSNAGLGAMMPGVTALAGTWVPLEDARQLCATGELNIPLEVGELFLERNLGETHFPEPLPEMCKARRHRDLSASTTGIVGGAAGLRLGMSMGMGTGMGLGLDMAIGGLAVANANVSAIAALAGLARMGSMSIASSATPLSLPLTPVGRQTMTSAVAVPVTPAPSVHARSPSPSSPLAATTQQQQQLSEDSPIRPLSPAMSALSSVSSRIIPPSLVRSVSATSVSSLSSALSSPPATPPPSAVTRAVGESNVVVEVPAPPKRRGPGRPRKNPLPEPGADPSKAATKKQQQQQRVRNVASAAPITSRSERASARSMRSAS